MNDELEKQNVMSNLNKLKNTEDRFKNLNVTDDYSIGERDEIKRWVGKAKAKNAEEGECSKYVWRVRATPKNGMRLAKIAKQQLNNSKEDSLLTYLCKRECEELMIVG